MGARRPDFLRALRVYVAKALAWAEPEVPGSTELARALLQPIETWSSPSSSAAKAAPQGDAGPGASVAPPEVG